MTHERLGAYIYIAMADFMDRLDGTLGAEGDEGRERDTHLREKFLVLA